MFDIRFILLALLAALAACSPEVNLPDPPTVAGTAGVYRAVHFKTFSSRGVVDVLASGGSVDLVLNADGTASGTMHIPAEATPGALAQDEALAGTWSIVNRDEVRLDLAGDPLVERGRYVVRAGQLLGTETSNGQSFEITLARP